MSNKKEVDLSKIDTRKKYNLKTKDDVYKKVAEHENRLYLQDIEDIPLRVLSRIEENIIKQISADEILPQYDIDIFISKELYGPQILEKLIENFSPNIEFVRLQRFGEGDHWRYNHGDKILFDCDSYYYYFGFSEIIFNLKFSFRYKSRICEEKKKHIFNLVTWDVEKIKKGDNCE